MFAVVDQIFICFIGDNEQVALLREGCNCLCFVWCEDYAGRVLRRNELVEAIWGFDSEIENNTLDAFLRLLRKKVDDGHAVKLIHTIRGFGYVLREESS